MGNNKKGMSLEELRELNNFKLPDEPIKIDKNIPPKNTQSTMGNIGFLYNHSYYDGEIDYEKLDNNQEFFKKKNKEIIEQGFQKFDFSLLGNQQINLKTTYPGLVVGLGYGHGIKAEGEFKLGFSFDYTSGLPIIVGSTVKGMLRSPFPNKELHKKASVEIKKSKQEYISDILKTIKVEHWASIDIDELEREIFDGKTKDILLAMAKRDSFFDAIITQPNSQGKIFGDDSITPHGKNPLRNPIPLLFMKILPNVTFQFDFKLHNGLISATQKLALFRQILLDFGIGAKTNVGYGQLK